MRARAQYEQALRDAGNDDDDDDDGDGPDLQVWDSVPSPEQESDKPDNPAPQVSPETRAGIKRRRPPIDPFAASGMSSRNRNLNSTLITLASRLRRRPG